MPNRRARSLALFLAIHLALLATAASASADPTVDKMGMVFHLVPHQPDKQEWKWTPQLRFRVAGPISSSATLEIQYTYPNGKPWLKVQCDSGATEANEWLTPSVRSSRHGSPRARRHDAVMTGCEDCGALRKPS